MSPFVDPLLVSFAESLIESRSVNVELMALLVSAPVLIMPESSEKITD